VDGDRLPTSRPDADNVAKAVSDGANGILWVDDSQIVDMAVTKRYGTIPEVRVRVFEHAGNVKLDGRRP
jgi:Holliday junction resolvase RusA-like endonuclease